MKLTILQNYAQKLIVFQYSIICDFTVVDFHHLQNMLSNTNQQLQLTIIISKNLSPTICEWKFRYTLNKQIINTKEDY